MYSDFLALWNNEGLSDERYNSLSSSYKSIYNILKNSTISSSYKEDILNNLINNDVNLFNLLIILGNTDNLDPEKVELAKNNAAVRVSSLLDSLKTYISNEADLIDSALDYIDSKIDYNVYTDRFFFYKEQNRINKEISEGIVDNETLNDYNEYLKWLADRISYTPSLFAGVEMEYSSETTDVYYNASTLNIVTDTMRDFKNSTIYVRNNFNESSLYNQASAILSGDATIQYTRSWLTAYFQLHKGTLPGSIENALYTLLSGIQQIGLLESIIKDSGEIKDALESMQDKDAENPHLKKNELMTKWNKEYNMLQAAFQEDIKLYEELNELLKLFNDLDKSFSIEAQDSLNPESYLQNPHNNFIIEKVFDETFYKLMTLTGRMGNQKSLHSMIEDLISYYNNLSDENDSRVCKYKG